MTKNGNSAADTPAPASCDVYRLRLKQRLYPEPPTAVHFPTRHNRIEYDPQRLAPRPPNRPQPAPPRPPPLPIRYIRDVET